jgi:hypothetical protein
MIGLTGAPTGVFIGLTVVLIGGAGILTGQALARTWRPAWQVVFACCGLGVVDRFLTYSLFGGPLLSVVGYLVDTAVITAMGLIAYRISSVSALVQQYPWIYQRASPFTYRVLKNDDAEADDA